MQSTLGGHGRVGGEDRSGKLSLEISQERPFREESVMVELGLKRWKGT